MTYQNGTDDHQVALIDAQRCVPEHGENADYSEVPHENAEGEVIHRNVHIGRNGTAEQDISYGGPLSAHMPTYYNK